MSGVWTGYIGYRTLGVVLGGGVGGGGWLVNLPALNYNLPDYVQCFTRIYPLSSECFPDDVSH